MFGTAQWLIPASGLRWQVIIHHCQGGLCHTHPLVSGSGTGGSFGAAIGRTGPSVGATLVFAPATQPSAERRTDLQSIVARSSSISAPAGVNVVMDSGVVVLRGTVANSDEKRLVENMVRLQPGVHDLRNELEVRGGNP